MMKFVNIIYSLTLFVFLTPESWVGVLYILSYENMKYEILSTSLII